MLQRTNIAMFFRRKEVSWFWCIAPVLIFWSGVFGQQVCYLFRRPRALALQNDLGPRRACSTHLPLRVVNNPTLTVDGERCHTTPQEECEQRQRVGDQQHLGIALLPRSISAEPTM